MSRRSQAVAVDQIRIGRDGPSWTDVQDWVGLADISPEAHSLYVKLRMHVNRTRGDNLAWPGKERLAAMMRAARGDYIDKWLKELIAIGAVEVEQVGMPAHNQYLVHNLPPDGYAGPLAIKEWTAQFDAVVKLRNEAAREKTRLQRQRAAFLASATPPAGYDGPLTAEEWAEQHHAEKARRAESAARKAKKPQVVPVTDENREQDPVTGQDREHVPGPDRVEPDVVEPDVNQTPSPALPNPARPAVVRADGGGVVLPTNPSTKPGDAQAAAAVLGAVLEDTPRPRRPAGASRMALLDAISCQLVAGWSQPDLTAVLEGGHVAAGSVGAVLMARLKTLGDPPPPPPSPAERRPWCGECESDGYRWLIDVEYTDRDGRTQRGNRRCPTCNPTAVANLRIAS